MPCCGTTSIPQSCRVLAQPCRKQLRAALPLRHRSCSRSAFESSLEALKQPTIRVCAIIAEVGAACLWARGEARRRGGHHLEWIWSAWVAAGRMLCHMACLALPAACTACNMHHVLPSWMGCWPGVAQRARWAPCCALSIAPSRPLCATAPVASFQAVAAACCARALAGRAGA